MLGDPALVRVLGEVGDESGPQVQAGAADGNVGGAAAGVRYEGSPPRVIDDVNE